MRVLVLLPKLAPNRFVLYRSGAYRATHQELRRHLRATRWLCRVYPNPSAPTPEICVYRSKYAQQICRTIDELRVATDLSGSTQRAMVAVPRASRGRSNGDCRLGRFPLR